MLTECFGDTIRAYLHSQATEHHKPSTPEAKHHKQCTAEAKHHKQSTANSKQSTPEAKHCKESTADTKKSTAEAKQSTPECLSEGLRSLFLHHLLQLRFNSHRVTATVLEEEGGGGEVVQSTHEAHVGSAIFPTASLFNHSCYPNIIFRQL